MGRASRSASRSATQRCSRSSAGAARPGRRSSHSATYSSGEKRASRPSSISARNRDRAAGATYPIVEAALKALRVAADEAGIRSIAMPRIAAGYGGLSWKKVKALIDAAFADCPGMLYVYEEYKPDE